MKYFFSCLTYFFLVFGQLLLVFNIYLSLSGYPMKHSFSWCLYYGCVVYVVDCKTVGFFLKISQEIGKAWRKSTLFKTFCLTARAYLNTQKYGLFCSLYMSLCAKEIDSYFELLSSYLSKYEYCSLLYSSGQQKQKQRPLQQKDKKGQARSLAL